MGIAKNKRLFDAYVVQIIVFKALTEAMKQRVTKRDISKFIDENLDKIIKETVKNNE